MTCRAVLFLSIITSLSASAQIANHVVISEVYGGGGNTGALYRNDFIELYNPTSSPVNLTGWSVQYSSATGTSWQVTNLSGTIPARGFFLIQQAQGTGGTQNLPTPDVIGTIAMSATAGKVALVSSTTALSGANPTSQSIVDLVGYGSTASGYEGSAPAPAPSNTTSIERKASATSTAASLAPGGSEERAGNGWDSNNNSADFVVQDRIVPQNSASPREPPESGTISGAGLAFIDLNVLRGGQTHSIDITVVGETDTLDLTHIELTLPSWAGGLVREHILLSQVADTVLVEGTTVRIVGVRVRASNPLDVVIVAVNVPDESGEFPVAIKTAAGTSETAPIANQPSLFVWSTPITIAEASRNTNVGIPVHLGSWVTVRGVVTVADEFETGSGAVGTGNKGPSYLQDTSGGMAVFSPSGVSTRVTIGEEVTLLGKVDQFNGLNQLDASTIVVDRHGTGHEVQPIVVTLRQIAEDGINGVEQYEGRLVRVNGVTVNTAQWSVTGAGSNYTLSDATGQLEVRINKAVDFANLPAPSGSFDIVGVVGQFKSASPFIGGYQLLPRFAADIIAGTAAPPIVTLPPFESSATDTSITLSWRTAGLATSEVRYGKTAAYELGKRVDETAKEEHSITVSGLQPATIYQVQLRSAVGVDTSRSANYIVVTRSPQSATQRINVYFNKPVDHSIAAADSAKVFSFLNLMRSRIQGAAFSIDIALYSLSGTVGSAIADDLIAAMNRGVRVRVIMEAANEGTAPPRKLKDNGVPFIVDTFGANDGSGFHHNKFAVFDYLGSDPSRVWVITGSWNPTDPGTNEHYQNLIEFQDVSIAAAYTREFEQMWGSTTAVPNAAMSRFGANKQWVAPSVFWVGNAYVRLFFSPQGMGHYGRTEQHIIRALNGATSSINLGLNLITRQTLVDAMRQRFDQGVKVRGVIGEISTTGSVFPSLSTWADVHEFSQAQFGLLHHKYAIIDGEKRTSSSAVVTGSHNWSLSANERNDENTVIVYSPPVAHQYLQEFSARYKQAGGTDIPVSVERTGELLPAAFELWQNYPNPFNPATVIRYSLPVATRLSVKIYNVLGQEVATLVEGEMSAGNHEIRWQPTTLPSGMYIGRLQAGGFTKAIRMMLLR